MLVGVAALLATACDSPDNRPPAFAPVPDAVFRVDVGATLRVEATDPDGDAVDYRFDLAPVPPSQAAAAPGAPRFEVIGGGALLSWTPTAADAGDAGEARYDATVVAVDEHGARATLRIPITVVAARVEAEPLRFVAPAGEGILLTGDCLVALPVETRGAGDAVSIEADTPAARCDGAPGCAPLALVGAGPQKALDWCPTPSQLQDTVHHPLRFSARSLAGDAAAGKRFFVRFHRDPAPGCGGSAPRIEHVPPNPIEGPLDYVIEAEITDDLGIKTAPVLAYAVDLDPPPADPRAIDGWQAVAFVKQGGDRWQAAIPNLGLPPGERATIAYAIFAVDNDDEASTACDHTAEAGVFTIEVRGGDEPGPAYPPCTPCRGDAQCGGADDRCALMFDGAFCARGCAEQADCGEGGICAGVALLEGGDAFLCVPADQDCGQLCMPDRFEMAGNDTPETAAPLDPGVEDALTLCDEDRDYFAVPIEAGDAVTVRALFDGSRGDLDLGLGLPGEDALEHQSVGGGGDLEEVHEPCAPRGGLARVAVWAFDGRVGPYTLDVQVGPGECDAPCIADRYESVDGGNDALDHAAEVRLPFQSGLLTICPGDRDFYAFRPEPGSVLRIDLHLGEERVSGDLGLRLWRGGDVIARSASFRQAEAIDAVAGLGGDYAIEVFGQTDRSQNTYTLSIEAMAGMPCAHARQCQVGQICLDGICVDDRCQSDLDCGEDQVCVTALLGQPADAQGGRCAPRCRGERDCRVQDGFACKPLGGKAVCLLEGAQPIGQRCARHEECAADAVCLDLPGGYCGRVGCDGCPPDTACAVDPTGLAVCLRACDGPGDCRVAEGYGCGVPHEADAPICWPEGAERPPQ